MAAKETHCFEEGREKFFLDPEPFSHLVDNILKFSQYKENKAPIINYYRVNGFGIQMNNVDFFDNATDALVMASLLPQTCFIHRMSGKRS